jgi:Uma2 family endonuclease
MLCAGDVLTRDEFERRYAAMPQLKKAELIEGVVYIAPPVRFVHGQRHALLTAWLGAYVEATPGTDGSCNGTLRLDLDNEPQPDVVLHIVEPTGSSHVDQDGFLAGAPELIVEVAASSVSYALHQKLHVYRRAGVREYLVLRTEEDAVDWFALRGGAYERLVADAKGILRSEVFPGLWLDVAALLRAEPAALRAGVTAGTATAEHAAFRAQLGPPR